MTQLKVYGLNSCDTCRKARKWLDSQKVDYQFYDVRKDGLEAAELKRWLQSSFGDKLLNRQSTTWRQLSDKQKDAAESEPLELLLEHPALIKRPVFVRAEKVLAIGFKPETLSEAVNASGGSQ